MNPHLAALVFAVGIAGLYFLERAPKIRTSKALWLPVVWLLIICSRPISGWLGATGLRADTPTFDSPDQYLEGSPFDRNIFAALLILGLIALISRRKRILALLRQNGPILLYFAYCAVSVLWSDYPDVAFKRWIKAIGDLVMVLVVLTDQSPIAAVKRLLSRVGFLLLPASMLCIKYYPDLGRAYEPGFGVWMPMYTGVTTTKNLLGMITLIFGVGAMWRLTREYLSKDDPYRRRRLIAQSALLAMAFWLFWMADSATSMACFLMAACVIIATTLPRLLRKPALLHLMVAAMLSVSFFALFLDADGGLLKALGRNTTLTGRTALWDLVLGTANNRVVGTGYESFWLGPRIEHIWSVYWWHPNEAHNGYIEVLVNLGWIGVGLLVLLLAAGYRNVMATVRREPAVGGLMLAYFVIAVVYNCTESAMRLLNPIWFFFLLATVAVPQALPPQPASDSSEITEGEFHTPVYEVVA